MGQPLIGMTMIKHAMPASLSPDIPQRGRGATTRCANFTLNKMSPLSKMPRSRTPASQRGVVLFIALIALVAMTLAGIALMRSVDTANVIAGNFAFKETTLHAADFGTEQAFTTITAAGWMTANGNLRVIPPAQPYYYFPVMQPLDAQGVPTTINVGFQGYTNATNAAIPIGYTVQFVVERECTPLTGQPTDGTAAGPSPTNAAEIAAYCITAPVAGGAGGSKNADAVSFTKTGIVYYRITIRVTGPHSAVSMVQSTISL